MDTLSNSLILRLLREMRVPIMIIPESMLDSDDIDEENFIMKGLKERNKKSQRSISVIPNVL